MDSTYPRSALLSLQPTANTAVPRAPRRGRRPLGVALGAVALIGLGSIAQDKAEPPQAQIVSGAAELRYTETGYPQRWAAKSLTLSVEADLSRISPDAVGAASRAVAVWQEQAELPRVSLESEAPAEQSEDDAEVPRLDAADLVPDGKNTIGYRRLNLPGHRKDLAITVAYSDPRTGEVVEADIYVNARRDFGMLNESREVVPSCATTNSSSQCGSRYDLQSVLTHELGHFFGLGEDVADPLSTMYECTSACETHKRALTPPDQLSAAELYLAASPEEPQAGGCSVRSSRTPSPITWTLLAGFVLLVARRRSRTRA
ncbi:MAG: hypothetical protein H6718_02950 [Polyangiaceae bacterium]|nr:hypothetical protein [Myxococcales bacterium]MCB9584325.1 hypothetical protein [Polyangiaceae bacterium]